MFLSFFLFLNGIAVSSRVQHPMECLCLDLNAMNMQFRDLIGSDVTNDRECIIPLRLTVEGIPQAVCWRWKKAVAVIQAAVLEVPSLAKCPKAQARLLAKRTLKSFNIPGPTCKSCLESLELKTTLIECAANLSGLSLWHSKTHRPI